MMKEFMRKRDGRIQADDEQTESLNQISRVALDTEEI